MRKFLTKISLFIVVSSLIPFQISCTKEKAEALKTASKDFRTQSDAAIDKLDRLFIDEVAFAPLSQEESVNKIVTSLVEGPPGRGGIEDIIYEAEPRAHDTNKYSQKLNQIRSTYQEFDAMFEDLPRGHYFAGDAVARSETLAKKLVAQMVFLANHIRAHPFKLNARIQLAVEKRRQALAETDLVKRQNTLSVLATELLAIRSDTKAANEAAVLECMKAAEIGLRVVVLIQDYKKMSVNDILAIVRDGLSRVNQLTGKDTAAIGKRIDEIMTTIRSDSDWNAILTVVTTEMNA